MSPLEGVTVVLTSDSRMLTFLTATMNYFVCLDGAHHAAIDQLNEDLAWHESQCDRSKISRAWFFKLLASGQVIDKTKSAGHITVCASVTYGQLEDRGKPPQRTQP